MMQTQILGNSVHRPHSQLCIWILSRCLFHEFVVLRACGRQRPPDVVFWLKLVSVLGLKIVILLKNSFTTVFSCESICSKGKELLLSADAEQRDLVWTFTQTSVKLHSCRLCSSISYSAMKSISQWTCSSDTSKRLRTQLKWFDLTMRMDISIHLGEM